MPDEGGLLKKHDTKQVSKLAHLFLYPCTAPHVKPPVIAKPVRTLAVAIRSPVPMAPLPKGGIPHRTSCYVPVGDDAHIVPLPVLLVTLRRGDPCGRPPGLYRISYNVSLRGRTAPTAKRGVGDAAPYEVLSVNGV